MKDCCFQGFRWGGEPTGREAKVADKATYIAGSEQDAAIILVHDVFGWTFGNLRLLADHFAAELGVTVYLPDFFHGEVLPADILMDHDRWPEIDVWGFIARNSKEYRGAEMMEFAKSIRAKHKRVGAVGYCIGAWGAFQMGSKDRKLVDCVMIAHPTSLDKKEIDDIDVPVQILAPQHDPVFTEELKSYCNETIPKLGLAYDYQFFPKATHGFANRGDTSDKVEVKALERGKNATVSWFKQWLLE